MTHETKHAGPWHVSEPVDMGPMGPAWDVKHANGETYSTTNDLRHAKITAAGLNQAWSKAGGPDLLAALETCARKMLLARSDVVVRDPLLGAMLMEGVDAARAAIAKATGRPS